MHPLEHDIAAYEAWLRQRCTVVEADLDEKHARMREHPFDFLRATYFRWARTIEALCPTLAGSPRALCIGDIHIENFGTWRDADARLVWGVNDFDEAAVMPTAFDLVRLCVSATLAPKLGLSLTDAAAAVLDGYRSGLALPAAALLDEHVDWLRKFANPTAGDGRRFWRALDACRDAAPPRDVAKALRDSLPKGAEVQRYVSMRKGCGSLGRPRFAVVALWNSGRVVREAKALLPSAWRWAHRGGARHQGVDAAYGRYRSPDRCLHAAAGCVIRRIAPDARKLEIDDIVARGFSLQLIAAMAADLAAVHAASVDPNVITADVESRKRRWLYDAAAAAREATRRDFEAYRARRG